MCKLLVNTTGGKLISVYLTGSGSEATEAAIKLSRQFFFEQDNKTPRVNFITRRRSYHGNTIGALSLSEFSGRREPFECFLLRNVHHISSCYPYRQLKKGESNEAFVAAKAAELEAKFLELGPNTIIGFIAEPVVGAALGCVPCVPGYLKAMRDVCHKYGALFILDEVMCGMGRTGTLHAWEQEGVLPDIQIIGKGLGGGYQPIAAILISEKIVNRLKKGTGSFVHGQTYESMPIQAAAALEVQKIIQKDNLLYNVRKQGAYLEKRLKQELSEHPNVGDIRRKGLFWGIEFVKNKNTKEPFDRKLVISDLISKLALSPEYNITVYPGSGSVDGFRGDHIIIAPPFIITQDDVDIIVYRVSTIIRRVFNKTI